MDDEQSGSAEQVSKRQRVREVPDMDAFCRRVVRAIGKRAEDGDMAALEALDNLLVVVKQTTNRAAWALHAEPWSYSWSDIGNALNITKQSAWERFGQPAEPAKG